MIFQGKLNNLTLDLTKIDTFPLSIQYVLISIQNPELDNINLATYLTQISMGLTQKRVGELS